MQHIKKLFPLILCLQICGAETKKDLSFPEGGCKSSNDCHFKDNIKCWNGKCTSDHPLKGHME